jgi:heat-inducible transcriptional repressor
MRVLAKSLAERRRMKVLDALVRTYISTGSPVPSSRVLARSRLDVSPATVRSVMAQLDELGFTVQPHTSAGRIPTQKGFKAFVESLVFDDANAREFWSNVEENYALFGDQEGSIGALLERCCALLSEASGEAGVVLSPGFVNDVIREIKLVEVGPGRVLAVVISDLGMVTSSTIHVGHKLSYFNLKRIEGYLNAKLRGPDFSGTFSEDYLDEAEREAGERLYSEVVLKYMISGWGSARRQLYLEGFSRIFEKKEMQNPDAACSAIRFFEERSRLMNVLASCQRNDGLSMLMGDEIQPSQGVGVEFGLVAAPYKVNAIPAGALGVIGSMRMSYSQIVPLVEQAAVFVSRKLSEICGRAKIALDHGRPFSMVLRPRMWRGEPRADRGRP